MDLKKEMNQTVAGGCGGFSLDSDMPEADTSSSLDGAKQKKFSSASLSGSEMVRPKVVTVKHPESNKPKPTVKKSKQPIQADLDVTKEFVRCKDEGLTRLDLSKSNITHLPPTLRDLTHLSELYLYGNKIVSLPTEIGCLVSLQTLALSENSLTSLPDSLIGLKSIKVLDLRHNKLNDIPDVIYKLTTLTTLFLRYVQFIFTCYRTSSRGKENVKSSYFSTVVIGLNFKVVRKLALHRE